MYFAIKKNRLETKNLPK